MWIPLNFAALGVRHEKIRLSAFVFKMADIFWIEAGNAGSLTSCSSSYYESLMQLNQAFQQAGKPKMDLVMADEYFEDEDLLEMVDAGLMSMIVIDSHKANFWGQIFDHIKVHPDIALRSPEGAIGVMQMLPAKLKKGRN